MYCNISDIKQRISEDDLKTLTSDGGEEIDEEVVEGYITEATNHINDYLRGTYDIDKIKAGNHSLMRICRDRAIIFLTSKNHPNNQLTKEQKEELQILDNDLLKIKRGIIDIELTEDTAENKPGFRAVNSPPEYFTDTMRAKYRGR